MENYNNLALDLIPGETPNRKFDYLKSLLWENTPEVEVALLNVIYDLKKKGKALNDNLGSDSYVERCALFDAERKIYHLTNKCKIEKLDFGHFLSQIGNIK